MKGEMMIAVLVDSRKEGSSMKVATRQSSRICLSGLDGDIVRILFFDDSERPTTIEFHEDCEMLVNINVQFVQAQHYRRGSGRVFVDLLR